jgi:hypothetical protein
MIERGNPNLSITRQCAILSISRSSFYYATSGESEANLALMRRDRPAKGLWRGEGFASYAADAA